MEDKIAEEKERDQDGLILLVAVDFSPCSELAMKKAKSLLRQGQGRIVALHVIDHGFVEECIKNHLGTESQIKKDLFLQAKSRLRKFFDREGMNGYSAEGVVCEGIPCVEINKKAVEINSDMIIMGSKGKSEDMKTIFFGSTAERVLRFITRPVLCVPPEADYRIA
ncbi:MAG: universal stress protein [Deltaproteobacteria bacterium]|nr:universal stress protein [Deltaproteobacteria bacterium]MBW2049262.1 universal stress protein [Deltaproteobacteria bacterium]MBW2111964.1 universal stress protein [Deltaproteobacteria bacterium]MBW2353840.1 universal stress protein [Deltaproteobacteria bacterium]HDZ91659.1 universal stress protein [Deltaproteobacteria bacterium]